MTAPADSACCKSPIVAFSRSSFAITGPKIGRKVMSHCGDPQISTIIPIRRGACSIWSFSELRRRCPRRSAARRPFYVSRGPDRLLVDCGEGTQRQLMRARLGFRGLRHVLLTHAHLDHIAGLAGLVATRALYGIEEPIDIVGSAETVEFCRALSGADRRRRDRAAGYRLRAVEPGRCAVAGLAARCIRGAHRGTQSLGYRFEEEARAPLLPDRLMALGVPDGPLRRDLGPGPAGDARRRPADHAEGAGAPNRRRQARRRRRRRGRRPA